MKSDLRLYDIYEKVCQINLKIYFDQAIVICDQAEETDYGQPRLYQTGRVFFVN